jgi:hypothetical protein
LHGYYPQGVINITMADGTVANNVGLSQIYVTGPTTFVSIWSGYYPSKPSGTKPSTTYTLDPASTYILRWYFPRMPLDVYIGMVARFPHANLHINIPKDACDDMVYAYAWKVRDGFPAGRKIYVEHQNEPWNFSPPFQAWLFSTFMTTMAVPSSLIQFHDYRDYYIYRAIQVHKIFRDVFTAAGRGSEIMGTVNCQMNNGPSQVTPYLNFALAQGQPLDAVACAPYYSLGMSGSGIANTVAAFNACDDDQAAEMVLHDITYDSTGMVTWIKSISDAVTAYNQANGKNAIMIGYEGNLEWASPNGSIHHDERSHDIQYNPNYYHAEQGWYKILQDHGFQNLHKYGIGIGWPLAWGDYHVRTQKHSLGDGLNGAANNRHFSVNPSSPFYVAPGRGLDSGTMLDQDIQVDSVRGQAFIDWNAGVGASAPTFSGGVKLGGVGPVHGFYTVSAIGGISDGGVYTQGNSLRWAGGERLGGVATYSNALNVITSGGFRLGGTIFRGSNYFVVATGGMSEGGRIIFGPVYRTFLAALTVTIQLSPQLKALYGGVPRVFTTWPGGKVALPFILIENYVESQPGEAVEHNRIFVQLAVYGADETTVRRFGRALQDTVDSPNQNRRSTREPLSWMTGDEQGCNRQPTTPPIRTGQKFYGTDLFRWGLMYQFEFVPLFQL